MTVNYKILNFLIIALVSLSIKAQTTVTGYIKDNKDTPIESANILIYDEDQNILAYTFSKTNGEYLIKVNLNVEKNILFIVNSLGFKKTSDTLKLIPNKRKYIVNFNLKEKIETLNEVVLKPNEKIAKQGNTTIYKVKAFNNGTEQTIEDVLKNLPGIEILKNGKIKAHGRLIDKLLIEGEDMFDQNYTILSKNLDAKVLNEVEILDDFEDNPVLANIIKSQKVAINLVLKDEYKNIWFGNLSVGLGTTERLKLASNIGLIKKKIKIFNFNNYNNIGLKALEQVETTSNYNTNSFSNKKIQPKINSIYNIEDNNSTFFKEGESNFNKALINSLSFVTNLNSNLKVRGTSYITNDTEDQLSESITTFNLNPTPITHKESNNTKLNNSIVGGELELKYSNGKKTYLKNTLVYTNKPDKINNQLLFNNNVTSELLKEKEYSLYNHLNFTKLVGKKNVVNNYLYFGKNKITQNSLINSPSLNDFFSLTDNNLIHHNSKEDLSVYGFKSKSQINYKKTNITLELGFEALTENKENLLKLSNANGNNEIDSIQNTLNYKQQKSYIKTDFKYKISKKIELTSGLSLDYINVNTVISKNDKLLLNPTLKLYLKNLKIGFVSFGYRKSYNLPESNLFLTNYQLSSFQSFKRGTNIIKFPKNNNYSFYYNIKNDLFTKSFNIRIRYISSTGRYSSSNLINQDVVLSTSKFVNNGDIFSSSANYTSYFKKLNLSTNIGSTYSFSNTPINANSLNFTSLKTYSTTSFITGRTYFKTPLNFDFKFNLTQTKSLFNTIKSTTIWKSLNLNSTYKLSKTYITSLNTKSYFLENGNFYFVNFKVDYTPEKSRFSYQFFLNNIVNEKFFSINIIDEFSTYQSTTRLLPRYLLVLVKYRF